MVEIKQFTSSTHSKFNGKWFICKAEGYPYTASQKYLYLHKNLEWKKATFVLDDSGENYIGYYDTKEQAEETLNAANVKESFNATM